MSSSSQRLAEVVLARRAQLELSQIDVWQAGGPSNTTLSDIENGRMENLSRTTARRLDVGLRWEPGSARTVWNGGEPTPLISGVSPSLSAKLRKIVEESPDLDEAERATVLRIIESA